MMINWLAPSIPRRVAFEVGAAAAAASLASLVSPWLLVPGVLAVAAIAWSAAHRHAARPLLGLGARVALAERDGYIARAATERTDEIGAVAQAANRLLARITQLEASLIDAQREIAVQRDVEGRLREALDFHASRARQQAAAAEPPRGGGQLR